MKKNTIDEEQLRDPENGPDEDETEEGKGAPGVDALIEKGKRG